jgi:hypothetical protein
MASADSADPSPDSPSADGSPPCPPRGEGDRQELRGTGHGQASCGMVPATVAQTAVLAVCGFSFRIHDSRQAADLKGGGPRYFLLHHTDPFDRLLIAQARAEDMVILTADHAFELYEVEIFWCGR